MKSFNHRDAIGGMWEEIGSLQFQLMCKFGLKPEMYFLDVGCGCFRGGRYFIEYLKPNHYFGIDSNIEITEAGYNLELPEKLRYKFPRSNLLIDETFKFEKFNQRFDIALAQSVFTHLPANMIRLCLFNISRVLKSGGVLYATFFVSSSRNPNTSIRHNPGEIETYSYKDPFHYEIELFEILVRDLPLKFQYLGNINHPRDQHLISFKSLN